MTRRRPGRTAVHAAIVIGVVVLVWVPALIAIPYTQGPGGVQDVWQRPDQGWKFLVDAVMESRHAQLGTSQAALQRAQDLWAGPPATAQGVTLTWTDGAFRVPVPLGGTTAAVHNRAAVPDAAFEWIVNGHVGAGPSQMIGMLDYASGRTTWDIRSRIKAAP
jgi:hypothetical protein